MQVGKTKDLGLYNKPSAAVHPGALAAGTLPQYNTIQYIFGSINKYLNIKVHKDVSYSKTQDCWNTWGEAAGA